MSTIDKINKLIETKEDIKQAIIEKGGSVLDTDPYSTYADKIRALTISGIVNEFSIMYQSNVPQLYLTGDISTMTKDVKVTLDAELKDKHGNIIFTNKKASVSWEENSSTDWDKKSFSMSFLESNGTTEYKFQVFADVAANDEYNFEANMEDGTRLRSSLGYKIAEKIYSKKLPGNQRSTMECYYIEIYINDQYQGFYDLNTKQNETVYGVDNTNANHLIYRGTDTGKSSAEFRALSVDNAKDVGDWVDAFPGTNTAENRDKLNRVIQWVMDCENDATKFTTELEQYFDKEYLIKYLIYCYIIGGVNNIANNLNMITFDGSIWYPIFYDLDATWGYDYQDRLLPTTASLDMKKYYDSLLFDLVEANLTDDIKTIYSELRQGVLSVDNLVNEFYITYYSNMDDIKKDLDKWGTYYPSVDIEETIEWIRGRLTYLDTYFQYSGAVNEFTFEWLDGYNELDVSNGTIDTTLQRDATSVMLPLKPGTYTLTCKGDSDWMGYVVYNFDTEVYEYGYDEHIDDIGHTPILTFTLTENKKVRVGANIQKSDTSQFVFQTTDGGFVV